MKYKEGAIVGAAVAVLFYLFLVTITPFQDRSVIPTGNVIIDSPQDFVQHFPKSAVLFFSLVGSGVILGVIGHRMMSDGVVKPD